MISNKLGDACSFPIAVFQWEESVLLYERLYALFRRTKASPLLTSSSLLYLNLQRSPSVEGLKIPKQTWLEPRGSPEWPTNAKRRALLKALQKGLDRHPTSQGCDADSGDAQREEEHHRLSSFAVTSRDADFGDAHTEEEHHLQSSAVTSALAAGC